MTERALSLFDRCIVGVDRVLRTLTDTDSVARRPSPAQSLPEAELTDNERRHAAGLMRVNHSGEVCAQALYQGQALTAKLPAVRRDMEEAAEEEIDHLVWCKARLDDLGSHPSYLNPLWYGLSFTLGAGAGLISDRVSLGFVAATEERVCDHLRSHLKHLPATDQRSRAVVEQMLVDETKHAQGALRAGGLDFPVPVKAVMTLVSKAMTTTSYRL